MAEEKGALVAFLQTLSGHVTEGIYWQTSANKPTEPNDPHAPQTNPFP